jgi:hypothetical protein
MSTFSEYIYIYIIWVPLVQEYLAAVLSRSSSSATARTDIVFALHTPCAAFQIGHGRILIVGMQHRLGIVHLPHPATSA